MAHWKTTLVGILKLIGAAIFIGVKVHAGQTPTTEDWAIAGGLASGGVGNIVSADAKAAEAPKP